MLSTIVKLTTRLQPRLALLGATATCRHKYTLPELPYKYDALEPVISHDIMEVHHGKHHATYVNNLNLAEEQLAEAVHNKDTMKVIKLLPLVSFNGGGHFNHSLFWESLSPMGGGEPQGDLMAAIKKDFGSFEVLKKELSSSSIAIQGSGWGWLGYKKLTGRLKIATTANQDCLEPKLGMVPLLLIDVWEHAYYLQYKNARADFVHALFNVINWEKVSERYAEAILST